MSCTIKMTQTSRVKFTITKDGDIRIKMSERHLQDQSKYEMIGKFIAAQLGPIDGTMRGEMPLKHSFIIMTNNSKTNTQIINLTECME